MSTDIRSESAPFSIPNTEWAGQELYFYETIDSTNTKAKELATEGARHGALIIADEQIAGKGRSGRSWVSQKGASIYMTLLLKPQIKPENAPMLTLVTAMAVCDGIESVAKIDCQIKWPNDILAHGKKVCGILTEMDASRGEIHSIVIGIGINVHNVSFSGELSQKATSVDLESGKRQSRQAIMEAVIRAFEHYYAIYVQTEDMRELVEGYCKRLINLHQEVRVLDPKDPFSGIAIGITPRGELIVDTKEGTREVSSGEVSVRGPHGYV